LKRADSDHSLEQLKSNEIQRLFLTAFVNTKVALINQPDRSLTVIVNIVIILRYFVEPQNVEIRKIVKM
jgi:hypothetical protein